jgi:lipoprotein signal peptidase
MFWFVFLLTFLLDQSTKLWAGLYFKTTLNYGVSFGWLAKIPSEITTLVLAMFALGLAYIWFREWRHYKIISGLFWAGAISNLFDRILLGGVSDWIPMPYLGVSNNLADIVLSLSLLALLIKELRSNYGH